MDKLAQQRIDRRDKKQCCDCGVNAELDITTFMGQDYYCRKCAKDAPIISCKPIGYES